MMNKKAFATRDFVIAGLLFTAIVSFFVIAIADMQGNYPDNPSIISESFSNNYDKLTELTEPIEVMRKTSLSGEGLTFRGAFDVTFGSFFTIMQLVFGTIGLFSSIYFNITADFPFVSSSILNNFMILGFAVITVIVIFQLINAVGRNKV